MGLSGGEDRVSGVLAGAPVAGKPGSSHLCSALGTPAQPRAPGAPRFIEPLGDAKPRVPRPAACAIGSGVIPRVPTLRSVWGDVFFRQNAASLAAPREAGRLDPLCLSDLGKQCSETELLLPLLFFTWHVGCLAGCAELEGMPVRRSSTLWLGLAQPQHPATTARVRASSELEKESGFIA